jgi:cytochrome c biogenesis protein CcmG/thiol:disulfide interchange protein DsbE
MRRLLFLVPVAVFAILAFIFYDRLIYGEPDAPLPSPLIGKPVPEFEVLPLDANAQSFTRADLTGGRPTVVNFWASWCAPCVVEAPVLERLSQRPDVTIYGVVHNDVPDKARAFLAQYGNPFARINADPQRRVSIAWGVTGPPETFVIDGQGIIRARITGALTERDVRDVILPALQSRQR